MNKYHVWDTETQTHVLCGRKASPFHPDNYVVLTAHGDDSGTMHSKYFEAPPIDGWLAPVLDCHWLVGFNIKFDILHAIRTPINYELWRKFITRGGALWDCQMAEYLLGGMSPEHHMLSLDAVSLRYGGELKVDAVKELWRAGVQTSDINPDLLKEYIGAGSIPGDIGNTKTIFLAQVAAAMAAKQLASIKLNMRGLAATIEMEFNGMHIDTEQVLKHTDGLRVEYKKTLQELSQHIPEPLREHFNWGSGTHKSALLFGGKISTSVKVFCTLSGGHSLTHAGAGQAYSQMVGTEYLTPTGWVIADAPPADTICVQAGKNMGLPRQRKVMVPDPSKPKTKNIIQEHHLPGFTKPSPHWVTARVGVWSTAADVIAHLATRDIPVVKHLAEVNALAKDLGQYFNGVEASEQPVGMLAHTSSEGIIHHSIQTCRTVTGRYSSTSPNLQNLARSDKSQIKSCFTSRFPGGSLIQSDFASLEVYVQAILTKDPELIRVLKTGMDMHCLGVSWVEGCTYEHALKMCKGDGNTQADSTWVTKRTKAKEMSFQMIYGAGAGAISAATGIEETTVVEFMKARREAYATAEEHFNALGKHLALTAKPTNTWLTDPVTRVTAPAAAAFDRTPDGKLYKYTQELAPEFMQKRGVLTTFPPPKIKNYSVQGTGAEINKAACWLILRALYDRPHWAGRVLLVNTVHDAVYLDCAQELVHEAASLLEACLIATNKYFEVNFGWQFPIDVKCETCANPSLKELGGPSPVKAPLLAEALDNLMAYL